MMEAYPATRRPEPIADVHSIERRLDALTAARRAASLAASRAQAHDHDGGFPTEDLRLLHDCGLLEAPYPTTLGGMGLSVGRAEVLQPVLTAIGRGNLALGRLYEGHVNAVGLVTRYGTRAQLQLLKDETDAGRPSGVWMAGEPLRLERSAGGGFVLRGRKILCSGAGHFRRPLVAANHEGGSVMVIPHVVDAGRIDVSGWTSHGMRATATGTVDFDGIDVCATEIVGTAGDYLRSPVFRGGAWRVIAVQLGALDAILEHYRDQLAASPHRDHPLQLARFGEASIARETARLWVQQAASVAESGSKAVDAEAVDAYVDFARNAFEGAALRAIGLAEKAVGLKAFLRPNPLERVIRDLTTYLRQPSLDVSLMAAASFALRQPPLT